MANCYFVSVPGTSHPTAALHVGRRLEAAGHAVRYLCIEDDTPFFRANGVGHRVILRRSAPAGMLERRSRMTTWQLLRHLRGLGEATWAEWMDDHRTLAALGPDERPDLFVVDALLAYTAFAPMRAGTPVLLLSATLPTAKEDGVPPLNSTRLPPRTRAARLDVERLWWQALLGRRLLEWATNQTGPIRQYARRTGLPWADVDRADLFSCNLDVPKMVLCDEGFDFERPPDPRRHYVGPCIDLARAEPDFPWHRLDPAKPLALCVLSTHLVEQKSARRLFDAAVEAFGRTPGLQLVVSTCGASYTDALNPAAYPNVVVVPKAPQLALLARAAVALTSGGLNTVKECIYHGVPMLVFPGDRDMPGYAARVAYHRLGYVCDWKKAAPAYVRSRVLDLRADAPVRQAMQAMRARFRAAQAEDRIVPLVEKVLRPPNVPL